MKQIRMVVEKKAGREWIPDGFVVTDELAVYRDLASSMVAKKLNGCRWIKSIVRRPNYDGTCDITITHDNGFRRIYTVKD